MSYKDIDYRTCKKVAWKNKKLTFFSYWRKGYTKIEAYLEKERIEITKAPETILTTNQSSSITRELEAKIKGFEGEACGECGNFTLIRNGTCMKCNTCGGTSGCS